MFEGPRFCRNEHKQSYKGYPKAAIRFLIMAFIEQMGNIGLLVAYVISWFISVKRGWHWINGVIAFLIAFALGYYNWFGWDHLSGVFLAPGRLFGQTSLWNFLLSGSIMLAIGLLLALWKKVQLFIDKGSYIDKKAIEEDKKKRRVM